MARTPIPATHDRGEYLSFLEHRVADLDEALEMFYLVYDQLDENQRAELSVHWPRVETFLLKHRRVWDA